MSAVAAWLGVAILVVAGSGIPEVAELMSVTFTLVIIYLLLTHYAEVGRVLDKLVAGLRGNVTPAVPYYRQEGGG